MSRFLSAFRRALAVAAAAAVLSAGSMALAPAVASAAVNPLDGACKLPGDNVASNPACQGGGGGTDPIGGPNGAIVKITGILATVAGVVALIFVIVGGFKYITANGDSSSISSAKQTIIYALIGLVVAMLARPLINFVLSNTV